MIVTFLCAFYLKEPKGSFSAHHEGEEGHSETAVGHSVPHFVEEGTEV